MKQCTKCEQLLSESEFYRKGTRLYSNCKKCFSKYCMDRWKKRKVDAIESMGGKCNDCKQSFPPVVYDFHHLDSNEKEFDWGKMRAVGKARLAKELAKCALLCSNCHRLRHSIL